MEIAKGAAGQHLAHAAMISALPPKSVDNR
jgi:hypothetical protein